MPPSTRGLDSHFVATSACGLCMRPAQWGKLEDPIVLFAVYGATFFFSNFGPNTTTFILPASTVSLPRSVNLRRDMRRDALHFAHSNLMRIVHHMASDRRLSSQPSLCHFFCHPKFRSEIRSSMNGFCAACGKFGALVGSSIFPIAVASSGWVISSRQLNRGCRGG